MLTFVMELSEADTRKLIKAMSILGTVISHRAQTSDSSERQEELKSLKVAHRLLDELLEPTSIDDSCSEHCQVSQN